MSPELVQESSYNAKCDVWALGSHHDFIAENRLGWCRLLLMTVALTGCLTYELCALKPPFQAETQAELNKKIMNAQIARIPPHYSSDLSDTIQTLLQRHPDRRPSTTQLLQHPRVSFCLRLVDLTGCWLALKVFGCVVLILFVWSRRKWRWICSWFYCWNLLIILSFEFIVYFIVGWMIWIRGRHCFNNESSPSKPERRNCSHLQQSFNAGSITNDSASKTGSWFWRIRTQHPCHHQTILLTHRRCLFLACRKVSLNFKCKGRNFH